MEEGLQLPIRVAEEERANCGRRHSNERCWHKSINDFLYWRQHFSR